MRKSNELRIECFGPSQEGCFPVEISTTDVESGTPEPAGRMLQPVSQRHTAARSGWLVAGLIGSLLLVLAMLGAPATSSAQVAIGVSVSFGPPALPVYVQPPCPAPGYIWTPGYWAWDPAYGYFWVPGTWVPAPFVGALWTPGYWAYVNSMYAWYPGYWGPVVGYYGGINYGYGYPGTGYYGGYWNRGRFYYNRAVNRITIRTITTVYNQRVVENGRPTRVSYHGGAGGTMGGPTATQLAAARQRRFGAVSQQLQHERMARTDPAQRASFNRGRPDVAATGRPGVFRGNGTERATQAGAPYNEPPRTTRGGQEAARPSPERAPNRRANEGAPTVTAPRAQEPRGRTQNSAPERARPAQPAQRNATPAERSPRQVHPSQTGRTAGHAEPQRQGSPEHNQRGSGGNGHENRGHSPR